MSMSIDTCKNIGTNDRIEVYFLARTGWKKNTLTLTHTAKDTRNIAKEAKQMNVN